MADGTIQIDVEVDGKQISTTSKELDRLGDAGQNSGKGLKGAEDGVKGVSNESEKAGMSIGKVATALGLVAVASVAFKLLRDSVGEAVQRFDTLERFPKVLQSLGVSAEGSERSMAKLSDGIDGLPTKLDDIANTAQRMYSSFGDMDLATDSALALNNALLASGAGAAEAKRGTEMYLKALQTGEMDMVTWRSLSETMNVGLDEIAAGFGFAGKSAKQDLYQALKDGTISMDEFNDKLVEVGTGTGRLADLARENSKGITTSLNNLKYAAAIGIANIIKSFDNLSKEVTGNTIAENIDGMKGVIRSSFAGIVKAIELTTPAFKVLATVVSAFLTVIKPLTPALIGLATAFAIHATVHALSNAIKANTVIQAAASAITNAYTVATSAQGRAMVLNGIQIKATGIILAAYNGIVALATTAHGLLTGGITLASVATTAFTGAVSLLGTAMQILMGPVGWVTLAIGALIGAVTGLVIWFNKGTEEGEALNKKNAELNESSLELASSIESSSAAYRENAEATQASNQVTNENIALVSELSEKENKSAEDKALLNTKIEELNGSVEGLSLSYSEESNALNMSAEQMENYVAQVQASTDLNEARERQAEIAEEMHQVEAKLDENTRLREAHTEAFEKGDIKNREYKDGIADLDEAEEALKGTSAELAEETNLLGERVDEAQEKMATATESGVERQRIAFASLSEGQQEMVETMMETYEELVDHTSNAFDRMNDESKASAEEMISNLQHNQEMIADWGTNVADLHEKAGKESNEGFIAWLDSLGPESAAELQVVNDMSDAELNQFIELMNEAPTVATDSFKESLGGGMDEAVDVMSDRVNELGASTREQIEAADFEGIGKDVTKGLGDGIEEGTGDVVSKSEGMADETIDATKGAFGVQSPSTIYKAIGDDLMEGLALGIIGSSNKVVSAIKEMFQKVESTSTASLKNIASNFDSGVIEMEKAMARLPVSIAREMSLVNNTMNASQVAQSNALKRLAQAYKQGSVAIAREMGMMNKIVDASMNAMLNFINKNIPLILGSLRALAGSMPRAFSSLRGDMRVVGLNAMGGLTSGLQSGRSRVMSMANTIARDVANTMKRALDINSPSRVMRDQIGKMIPDGIVEGIKANASNAYDAMSEMTKGLMSKGTPEMALGTGRMTYTGNSNNAVVASSIKSNATNGDKGLVGVLKEQTKILSNIARKNPDLYIDGEKVTKVVNDNNAIAATFRVFD